MIDPKVEEALRDVRDQDTSRLGRARKMATLGPCDCRALLAELDDLRARLKDAEEVVDWYGDEGNYMGEHQFDGYEAWPKDPPIEDDNWGARARAYREKYPREGEG